MTTKTIVSGCFYVTDGTVSGNTITYTGNQKCVEIFSSKIEPHYDNELSENPIPVPKGERDDLVSNDTEPYNRVVDLKRIKEAISVQGCLEDEPTESAKDKQDNLYFLGKKVGSLKVVWGRGNYQRVWQEETNPEEGTGVFIKQMLFPETAGLYGSSHYIEKTISSIDGDATTITVDTSAAHTLFAGDGVVISGTTNYNGEYQIANIIDSNTFTISDTSHNVASEATGTIRHYSPLRKIDVQLMIVRGKDM